MRCSQRLAGGGSRRGGSLPSLLGGVGGGGGGDLAVAADKERGGRRLVDWRRQRVLDDAARLEVGGVLVLGDVSERLRMDRRHHDRVDVRVLAVEAVGVAVMLVWEGLLEVGAVGRGRDGAVDGDDDARVAMDAARAGAVEDGE